MTSPSLLCQQFEEQIRVKLKGDWYQAALQSLQTSSSFFRKSTQQQLQLLFAQFLEADLNLAGSGCFPSDLKEWHKRILEGRFVVQVDEIVNSAAPIKERYKQAGKRRCLKLHLVDGVQRFFAMEFCHVPALNPLAPAGFKIAITDAEVRRGLLLLRPENVLVLGGKVDRLEEARQQMLQRWAEPPDSVDRNAPPRNVMHEMAAAAWRVPQAVRHGQPMGPPPPRQPGGTGQVPLQQASSSGHGGLLNQHQHAIRGTVQSRARTAGRREPQRGHEQAQQQQQQSSSLVAQPSASAARLSSASTSGGGTSHRQPKFPVSQGQPAQPLLRSDFGATALQQPGMQNVTTSDSLHQPQQQTHAAPARGFNRFENLTASQRATLQTQQLLQGSALQPTSSQPINSLRQGHSVVATAEAVGSRLDDDDNEEFFDAQGDDYDPGADLDMQDTSPGAFLGPLQTTPGTIEGIDDPMEPEQHAMTVQASVPPRTGQQGSCPPNLMPLHGRTGLSTRQSNNDGSSRPAALADVRQRSADESSSACCPAEVNWEAVPVAHALNDLSGLDSKELPQGKRRSPFWKTGITADAPAKAALQTRKPVPPAGETIVISDSSNSGEGGVENVDEVTGPLLNGRPNGNRHVAYSPEHDAPASSALAEDMSWHPEAQAKGRSTDSPTRRTDASRGLPNEPSPYLGNSSLDRLAEPMQHQRPLSALSDTRLDQSQDLQQASRGRRQEATARVQCSRELEMSTETDELCTADTNAAHLPIVSLRELIEQVESAPPEAFPLVRIVHIQLEQVVSKLRIRDGLYGMELEIADHNTTMVVTMDSRLIESHTGAPPEVLVSEATAGDTSRQQLLAAFLQSFEGLVQLKIASRAIAYPVVTNMSREN